MWHIELLKLLSKKVNYNEKNKAIEFIDELFIVLENSHGGVRIVKEITFKLLLIEAMYQLYGKMKDGSVRSTDFTKNLFGYAIICAKYSSENVIWNEDFKLSEKLVSLMGFSYPLNVSNMRLLEMGKWKKLNFTLSINFNNIQDILYQNNNCIDSCIKDCEPFTGKSDVFDTFVQELMKVSIINKLNSNSLKNPSKSCIVDEMRCNELKQELEKYFARIDGFNFNCTPLKAYKHSLIKGLFEKVITDSYITIEEATEYANTLFIILNNNHTLISSVYPDISSLPKIKYLSEDAINFFVQLEFFQMQVELFFSKNDAKNSDENWNKNLFKYRKLYRDIKVSFFDDERIDNYCELSACKKSYYQSFFWGFDDKKKKFPQLCLKLIDKIESDCNEHFNLKALKLAMNKLDIGLQICKQYFDEDKKNTVLFFKPPERSKSDNFELNAILEATGNWIA